MSEKHRVLVVDDIGYARLKIRESFEFLGHTVVGEASHGLEALALVKDTKPSLVSLDLAIPRLSGIEVLKSIKSQNPETIVIVITGIDEVAIHQEVIATGADAVFTKPFATKDLQSFLELSQEPKSEESLVAS